MTALLLLASVGTLGLACAHAVLALLCRRLGATTGAQPVYLWLWLAVLLLLASAAAQMYIALAMPEAYVWLLDEWGWITLVFGLPAIAVTIGVIVAWRYWSWLLAERD
jgi:hypothetical protein